MRFAILAPGLAYDAGAIPIRARLSGEALSERGHSVFGFGLALDGFKQAQATFAIECLRVPVLPSPLASLSIWYNYERALINRLIMLDREVGGLDVVISHWQTYGMTVREVCRNTNAKWVSVVHRTIYDIVKSGHAGRNVLMNWIIRRGCRQEFAAADAVIALHQSMAREITHEVPNTRRVEVIPNGVEAPRCSFEQVRSEKDANLALYVGRLDEEKRVEDLLVGFASCSMPEARLVIVGDGACRIGLERLAQRLGCKERVEFVGALSHNATMDWMRRASVFALASSSEGMPFVLLEAMAAGCAIVCSRIDGNEAILMTTQARFVRVGDTAAIGNAFSELLGHPLRAWELAQQSFARVASFAWPGIIEREVALYEQVANDAIHRPSRA